MNRKTTPMAPASRDNNTSDADQAELVRLLCRALSRLAVAAHGIDRRLDERLAELRQLLRRDIDDLPRLAVLVDAIDAQIKRVDEERDRHAEVLQQSLQKLSEQLRATKPDADIGSELKALLKQLKRDLPDGERLRLLTRLPVLQARVIAGNGDAPRGGLLSRWFARAEQTAAVEGDDDGAAAEFEVELEASAAPVIVVAAAMPTESAAVEIPGGAAVVAGEPPFARISTAVCEVLSELLQQIDPPPIASDDYRHAREQIAKGLNWYELVSTLEQISLIVLAALERDHGEFQQFLEGINKRLEDAHGVLESSRVSQTQRLQDDAKLNDTVRFEVAEIQVSVQQATQLDSLKTAIASRLDSVVGALDQHKDSEQKRQHELEQQLVALTARLREMESQSTAIERRLIEQQRLALLDMLTQLPNRQAYEQRLQQEYERWKRYGRPLTLAVCDIDHFKSINDNFGHLAGDKVLRIVAKTLAKHLRKTDFIARFGGEEFVVLMPETDQQAALQTIETIREAVATCPFHFREKPLSITLSAGIAVFSGNVTSEQVFERADTALYLAKQNGRNRCEVAA
jgi:diguanylate cyclase